MLSLILALIVLMLCSCGQAGDPPAIDQPDTSAVSSEIVKDSSSGAENPSSDAENPSLGEVIDFPVNSDETSADSAKCDDDDAHRFTVITSVSSEGVKAKCAVCGEETVLRKKQDFADFDRDESHFTYTIDEDGNAVITSYNCFATKVYFPATIDGHKVVSIDLDETMEWPTTESGFDIGGHITDVAIAPGIEQIEARAFLKWVSLSEVYLMEGLRSIGNAALARTSLQQVYLPDGLQSLGSSVFGRSNLRFLSIPASVE